MLHYKGGRWHQPTPNPSQEGNRRQEGREFGLFLPVDVCCFPWLDKP
ncbi:MAG: hypothetical protein F6J96_07630 [Symploca sp. SIO1C2]|nr:hypothetical protein [Symploca sp. SIO1C2]